jgi:hypothetical protein
MTGSDMTGSDMTGSDVSHITGSMFCACATGSCPISALVGHFNLKECLKEKNRLVHGKKRM